MTPEWHAVYSARYKEHRGTRMSKFVSNNPDLTFDDVLINPGRSKTKSRFNDEECLPYIMHGGRLALPIVSSPMDSIPSGKFIAAASDRLATIFTCRFLPFEKQLEHIATAPGRVGGVIGMNFSVDEIEAIVKAGAQDVVLDIANGGNENVLAALKSSELQSRRSGSFRIWAGNVANAETYRMLAEHCDFIRVGIGNGCLAGDSRVLMANGTYKNIKDINVGDRVINGRGEATDVVAVKFSGVKKVYRHRHNKFYKPYLVTGDHLHWTFEFDKDFDLSGRGYKIGAEHSETINGWQSIEEFSGHGCFTMPVDVQFELADDFEINLDDFAVRRIEDEKLNSIKPSYNLGYVLGWFLGDGNSNYRRTKTTSYGKVSFYAGANEINLVEKLADCVKSELGFDLKIEHKVNIIQCTIDSIPLARFFDSFGKKTEKHLPKEYLAGNRDYLFGIFDGLIDSDGHCEGGDKYYGRVSFNNTSERLIELFNVLNMRLFNIIPNNRGSEKTTGNLTNCNIENCNEVFAARVGNQDRSKARVAYNFHLVKSLSIEKTDIMVPTYDIEVADDSHSFIANNVVVHNSACTTRINTGVGRGTITSLLECREAYEELRQMNPNKKYAKIVCDGGLKYNGDFGKAFVAGAHMVMTGRLFAQTYESAAPFCYKVADEIHYLSGDYDPETHRGEEGIFKAYRGMASKIVNEEAGKNMRRVSVEGASGLVRASGPVNEILDDIEGNLRSTISYVGSFSVEHLYEEGQFAIVSPSVTIENRAHGFS